MRDSCASTQMTYYLRSAPLIAAFARQSAAAGAPKVSLVSNRRTAARAIPRQGEHLLLLELDDAGVAPAPQKAAESLRWLQRLAGERPGLRTIVLSANQDADSVVLALCHGACGYLVNDPQQPLDARLTQITTGMQELAVGLTPISPRVMHHLVAAVKKRSSQPEQATIPEPVGATSQIKLSARETEVLRLAAKGFSYAEMASLLDLSVHTVSTHIRRIYSKFDVNSRGEAIWEAARQGLLQEMVA